MCFFIEEDFSFFIFNKYKKQNLRNMNNKWWSRNRNNNSEENPPIQNENVGDTNFQENISSSSGE